MGVATAPIHDARAEGMALSHVWANRSFAKRFRLVIASTRMKRISVHTESCLHRDTDASTVTRISRPPVGVRRGGVYPRPPP
jgi:hypothetical protein